VAWAIVTWPFSMASMKSRSRAKRAAVPAAETGAHQRAAAQLLAHGLAYPVV